VAASDLTAARLRELLDYDRETGVFTWRQSRPKAVSGRRAGCISKTLGYEMIGVEGVRYYAHRLAILHVTGEWPTHQVDHLDGLRSNNCYANLRDVAVGINAQNMRHARKHGKSGLLGANWNQRQKNWRAIITVDDKQTQIGTYATAEEAHAAYLEAKRRMHQGCTI
jgi:hypothetical protein